MLPDIEKTIKKVEKIAFLHLRTPAGVRTLDPLIKSQMLYQLSYKRIRFLFATSVIS